MAGRRDTPPGGGNGRRLPAAEAGKQEINNLSHRISKELLTFGRK